MRPDPTHAGVRTHRSRCPFHPLPWLVTAIALLGACRTDPPAVPKEGTFEWTTYSNPTVGYTLRIPSVYVAHESKGGQAVVFRWQRRAPVKVTFANAKKARRRILWFGRESQGAIALGGRVGRRYLYTHCDGPFCSRMVAFVVPHRGRELTLEFRAEGKLPAVYRTIVSSFAWRKAN